MNAQLRQDRFRVPDIAGLSVKEAALAYAQAGIYVLPVAVGKHPGSIVGKGWPQKSSTDAEQIRRWWDQYPNAGIAIHTGPSGLTFFDLDRDTVPDELGWLKTAIVQFSRAENVNSERGHYGFVTGDDIYTSGDLKTTDGKSVGEIRSGNTVVIAAPSPHVKVNDGGQYRWRADDIESAIPKLPTEAQKFLRLLGTRKSDSTHATVAVRGVEAEDEIVEEAKRDWTQNKRPKSLTALVNSITRADSGTRNLTRNALRIAASESRIGFYSLDEAIVKIRRAMIESYEQRGEEKFDQQEFWRLVQNGVGYALSRSPKEIEAEANRDYGANDHDATDSEVVSSIFRQLGPTQWAQPVEPTTFLIRRVLSTDTWGVNGGPEKSLKTHDNQAIGLAVATGKNLYNDSRFTVDKPGKVVYIVGEGGENQVRRTLHRMLRAYGIKPQDVAGDPDFPFVVYFGAAPLDSINLRDELRALLDFHQPALVLMESFYNFHPGSVNAANLYERGQVIDSYHKLVLSGSPGTVSLLTDHNKKGANELGLQQISMAGQAENSDSWIQRKHRQPPDVRAGDFWLTTSFNGRDWGGTTFDIDWHLGPFDHDAGAHTGQISWDITDHGTAGKTPQFSALRADITALIKKNPWQETRSSLKAKLPHRSQDITNEIASMLADSIIEEDSPKNHGSGGKAAVFGLGPLSVASVASKLVPPAGPETP